MGKVEVLDLRMLPPREGGREGTQLLSYKLHVGQHLCPTGGVSEPRTLSRGYIEGKKKQED